MKKIKIRNKAFTLIELLVVITIIGILSGIVIVAIGDAVDRAKIAGSQRFSHSIRTRLALDMVGRWPFDNNTVDHSGWNNHGTLVTGTAPTPDPCAVRYPTGVTGQALCFDGVDDFVTVGNASVLQTPAGTTFTYEAWIRGLPGQVPNQMFINRFLPYFRVDAGRLHLSIQAAGIQRNVWGSTLLSSDRWHHVVATFDATGMMRVFLNGALDGTAGPFLPIDNFGDAMRFGIHGAPPGSLFYRGILDEVRIFRAAVPTSYIQKRYVEGVKSLAANGGITQEEKQQRIAELRNSGQLVIDLDAALVGPIDFSPYAHYFEEPPRGLTPRRLATKAFHYGLDFLYFFSYY